jgi:serine protease inhibitor ecotin
MLDTLLSVSLGTATMLAYTLSVVIVIFLLAGPSIAYYFWRKNRRMKAASPTGSA